MTSLKKITLLLATLFFLLPMYAQYYDMDIEDDMTEEELGTKKYWDGYKGTRYGVLGNDNNVLLPIIYEKITPIDSLSAIACFEGKHGVLGFDGQCHIPFIYDNMYIADSAYLIVSKNGLWGVIGLQGETVIPLKYGGIRSLNEKEKLFFAKKKEDKKNSKKSRWSLIGVDGKKKNSLAYDNIKEVYRNGAVVVRDKKRGLVDSLGTQIIATEYNSFYMHQDFVIARKDSLYGVFDYKGNMLIPVEYSEIKAGRGNCSEKIFTVCKDGKYGLISIDNEILIPLGYHFMGYFSESVSGVGTDKYKYAIINTKGELVTPFEFGFIYTFYNGIAATNKKYKYGVIDTEGKEVIPFIYQSTSVATYKKGYIEARMNDKYGIINLQNEIIIPFEYEYIYPFYYDVANASKNGKQGLIDKCGNVLLPFEFDIIMTFYEGVNVVGIKDSSVNSEKEGPKE